MHRTSFLLTFSADVLRSLSFSVAADALMTCGAYCLVGYELWRNVDPNRGSRHICYRIIVGEVQLRSALKTILSVFG